MMPPDRTLPLELDPTWKTAIEWKLEQFLAFAFPEIHRLIDWKIPPVPLDAELQKLAPENERGLLNADKLFKVALLTEQTAVLYLHVEIQGQRLGTFETRMWAYNSRLCDRFGQNVISLAVLVDEDPNWRPSSYRFEFGGFIRFLQFPIFKLWDCANPEKLFEQTGNPFSLMAAATQAAWRTRKDMEARGRERLRLVKYLYGKGLGKEDVRTLFRLIGWLTRLPENLELKFRADLAVYEEKEKPMTVETLLSPYEWMMQEKGRQEGLQTGRQEAGQGAVLDVLEARFGPIPQEVVQRVRSSTDETKLRQASRLAATASSFADFLARS
jgi:hypothetical protein